MIMIASLDLMKMCWIIAISYGLTQRNIDMWTNAGLSMTNTGIKVLGAPFGSEDFYKRICLRQIYKISVNYQ